MSAAEIGKATQFDKSTVQRFVHTLVNAGYLHRNPVTRRYELTIKNVDLGYKFLRSNPMVNKVLPHLAVLSMETDETVSILTLVDTRVVIVARMVSRYGQNPDLITGSSFPAFCTASGLAILSWLPRPEALEILSRSDLRPYTEATVYDVEQIERRLDESKRRGYAVAVEELYRGDISIAAAIIDAQGKPWGAVSIGLSRSRYTPKEAEEKFSQLVIATSQSIHLPEVSVMTPWDASS